MHLPLLNPLARKTKGDFTGQLYGALRFTGTPIRALRGLYGDTNGLDPEVETRVKG